MRSTPLHEALETRLSCLQAAQPDDGYDILDVVDDAINEACGDDTPLCLDQTARVQVRDAMTRAGVVADVDADDGRDWKCAGGSLVGGLVAFRRRNVSYTYDPPASLTPREVAAMVAAELGILSPDP